MPTWHRSVGTGVRDVVLFIHGNGCSSAIWEPLLASAPLGVLALAPDFRGCGRSDPAWKIDPARGIGGWVDDIVAFVEAVLLERNLLYSVPIHVVGHSLGGMVAMGMVADGRIAVASLTLYAPGPPGGYRSRGPDAAFVQALAGGDREVARQVIRSVYWHPAYRHPDEEAVVDALLQMQLGAHAYPEAVVEAVSPERNTGLEDSLIACVHKPPIRWVRGTDDLLVADDGPNAPGQKMVEETRAVFRRYAEAGGTFEEVVYERCGHSPFLEVEEERGRLWELM